MIAFGCVTCDHDAFRSRAAAAMQAVIEGNSLLLRRHDPDSPAAACNEMLAEAALHDDLETFVLVDQATTFVPAAFLAGLRALFAWDPRVAVIGGSAASGVPNPEAAREPLPPDDVEEVVAVDGAMVALSPWAVHELRFDPGFDPSIDACAIDLCRQARAHDRRVLVASMGVVREEIVGSPGTAPPETA